MVRLLHLVSGFTVLFVIAGLLARGWCAADVNAPHALDILVDEQAKAETTQRRLRGLLQGTPQILDAQVLLDARQQDIVRRINAVIRDPDLLPGHRQKIVDALESENATLRDQAALLRKARQMSP
jgi:hypothetical protein